MSQPRFLRRSASLPLALFSALAALTTATNPLQAKDDGPAHLLAAELPRGTALERASCSETVFATRQAVRKHPALAIPIMQCAINSRVSPGDSPAKAGHARPQDDEEVVISCECLTRIVQAALQVAPVDKLHEIIEVAVATQPQCATEITDLLYKPGIDFKDGPAVASADGRNARNGDGVNTGSSADPDGATGTNLDPGSFGSGFGTGTALGSFPGSPGFGGSASGVGLFPPVVLNPVTSAVNP